MSDILKQQAFTIYMKLFAYRDQHEGNGIDFEADIREERAKAQTLLTKFLCTCQPAERFTHREFPTIIMQSAARECFEAGKAAEAFSNLENYTLLLCILPWKTEFYKLKKYGGFYQTKIESHLASAESFFRLIGYTEVSPGLFQFNLQQSLDSLLFIAFECFIAFNECKIIEDIWRQTLKTGIHILDIVKLRLSWTGSVTEAVNWITKKYVPSIPKVYSNNQIDSPIPYDASIHRPTVIPEKKRDDIALKGNSPADFRTRLNEHLQNVHNIEDIPFIDHEESKEPNYEIGNFDEHLKASLQIVGEKKKKPEMISDAGSGSKEWQFVNEGLQQKYGKEYFEGPRKDILEDKNKAAGYVKLMALDGKHKYVNISDVGKPVDPSDSAYASQSIYAPADNPRLVDDLGQSVSNMGSVTYPPPRNSKSEPIAKRQPPPPPHQSQNLPYQSYTHPVAQNTPRNVLDNTSNIERLSKQSSILSVNRQPMVGYDSSYLSNQSVAVNSRNQPDSNGFAKTIHASHSGAFANNSLKKGWSCSHCTFENSISKKVCEVCSRSRDAVDTDSPPVPGLSVKVCNKCTLENAKDASVCSACGFELQRTQTHV